MKKLDNARVVKFLIAAEQELIEAVIYYNSQSEGLGFEFAVEVNHTLTRIIKYPLAWHKLSGRTHRCRTNRFPYGVIYQIRKDCIMVIAVMHLHRKPETWQERIKKTTETTTINWNNDTVSKTIGKLRLAVNDASEKHDQYLRGKRKKR